MKMIAIAAAGLVALTGLAPGLVAPAAAQRTVVTERTVVRHDGPDYRHHARTRQVCRWERRHHQRVRVCRTVRSYR